MLSLAASWTWGCSAAAASYIQQWLSDLKISMKDFLMVSFLGSRRRIMAVTNTLSVCRQDCSNLAREVLVFSLVSSADAALLLVFQCRFSNKGAPAI